MCLSSMRLLPVGHKKERLAVSLGTLYGLKKNPYLTAVGQQALICTKLSIGPPGMVWTDILMRFLNAPAIYIRRLCQIHSDPSSFKQGGF